MCATVMTPSHPTHTHAHPQVIEEVVGKMAVIFKVQPGGGGGAHAGIMSKAQRMMTGSRHAEIKTKDS